MIVRSIVSGGTVFHMHTSCTASHRAQVLCAFKSRAKGSRRGSVQEGCQSPYFMALCVTTFLCILQNLVRGRGLFCRAVMKSQMASPTFTPVYSALVAVVNTKFPEIGELLLKRVILQVCGGKTYAVGILIPAI